ncbi:MAG TPA: 6-carboxytetrahydropterin synthase [Campylobacterales bacterium]|nr:6-carboxytetrahydropterin synthase [Campylobacterales bacterium]
MIIRKLFKFENAHIVRGCSTERCKYSIHGHSYKAEILLSSDTLDNGQMVMDFGLLKGAVRDVVDSFDHAIAVWDKDDADYIEYAKRYSHRWAVLPISPSAEQFSRLIFVAVDAVLREFVFANGEVNVELHSIIVHETETGYAQCFREDAYSAKMGEIELKSVIFSDEVKREWNAPNILNKLFK